MKTINLKPSMTVAELELQLNSEYDVFTLNGSKAGENRKLRALTSTPDKLVNIEVDENNIEEDLFNKVGLSLKSVAVNSDFKAEKRSVKANSANEMGAEKPMYELRKCEEYTIVRSSEIAYIDPEKFRNLSTPCEGDSEEDFLDYISQLYFWDLESELDEETRQQLIKLEEPHWNEFYNSAFDGSKDWYELGEENENAVKNGGFETKLSTE